jgi:hypothetical protein
MDINNCLEAFWQAFPAWRAKKTRVWTINDTIYIRAYPKGQVNDVIVFSWTRDGNVYRPTDYGRRVENYQDL